MIIHWDATISIFPHHKGDYIKLAYADQPEGPWRIYAPGAIHVKDTNFAQSVLKIKFKDRIINAWSILSQTEFWAGLQAGLAGRATQEKMKAAGKKSSGALKHYIATPDIMIDHDKREIRMYLHGLSVDGMQDTRLAISQNGVDFKFQPEVLVNLPYFKSLSTSGLHIRNGHAGPALSE